MGHPAMNHVERFRAVMSFEAVDRLPRWEWAMWWDQTIDRWHGEGLPRTMAFEDVFEISEYFGLDPYQQFWFGATEASEHFTEGGISNMDDYLRIKPYLFPDHEKTMEFMHPWAERQKRGEAVVWATLEGFFWVPRTLMDIEKLSYAFFDQPELVHTINRDLLEFNLDLIRGMEKTCVPTFMTLAEDMSYNQGPMISRKIFDEFLAPYYRPLVERLRELNVILIVDTDGDVTELVPWLETVGVQGVLPLERQAGVDGNNLREQFPNWLMVGHFNKMVMSEGEQALREEFERLRPLIKSGGFIPSVDHQTPPHVSMDQYRQYLRLLTEYTRVE